MKTPERTPVSSLGRPLAGVRVLDLTRLLPGPFATLLLADMGADVVKVEHPQGGDETRFVEPLKGPMGAFFASINRGKRSIAVNLKSPEGQDILGKLIARSDVLIESFRPGVLARLGFDDERLARDFPRLVVCSISGYGQDGPAVAEAGHDLNYIARAGLLHATGTPDGRVTMPGFQAADVAGGALYAVSGVLAALYGRERSGRGARLDISMTEGALSLLIPALGRIAQGASYPGTGRDFLTGGLPCYQVYETADGLLALAALEPVFWDRFRNAVGLADASVGTVVGPPAVALRDRLAAMFRERSTSEWMAILEPADCCCVPVRRPDEVFDDPLFVERDVFFATDHDMLGSIPQVATPLTPHDRSDFTPPPLLGEHTSAVLRELGFTEETVTGLAASGAVLQHPLP